MRISGTEYDLHKNKQLIKSMRIWLTYDLILFIHYDKISWKETLLIIFRFLFLIDMIYRF